jgi:hypothetical protein
MNFSRLIRVQLLAITLLLQPQKKTVESNGFRQMVEKPGFPPCKTFVDSVKTQRWQAFNLFSPAMMSFNRIMFTVAK